jgi:hypothetical protein
VKLRKTIVRMPRSVNRRSALPALLSALVALALAGCGGSDDGGDTATPAEAAPPGAPVFIDFTVRPKGETKVNIESLAKELAGIDDLGDLIVTELEESAAEDGEPLDYEKEVEPWLGDEGGMYLREYKDDDFEGYGVAIQTTDEDAARDFIDKQVKSEAEPAEDGSYEDVDFKIQEDGTSIGVFNGLIVLAEDEGNFKAMVDAANGDSLGGEETYTSAVADVPQDSAADVYVDVGGLIEEAGGEIDEEAKQFLDSVGIEPQEATAVASLVPGSDYVEIEVISDLGGEEAPSGDASQLLGSLPSESVGAVAIPNIGERLQEGLDELDKKGIPGEIPPNQLKDGLGEAGIDLDGLVGSIESAALFVTGQNEGSLSGVLVLTTDGSDGPEETISSIGQLLKSTGTPGVRLKTQGAKGFEVNSPELEGREVKVLTMGDRVVIGFGGNLTVNTALALLPGDGAKLADRPVYKDAVKTLGSTPISGFVDGPRALKLAESFISPADAEFEEFKPFLSKVSSIAIGSEPAGDRVKVKLLANLK